MSHMDLIMLSYGPDIWSHMDLNSPLIDLIMSHMDLKKAPYGPEEVTYGHRKVTSFEH